MKSQFLSNKLGIVKNGIITQNPTFRLVLGMCPTLAVTTSAFNGLGMGLAATVVLICSNALVSLLRKVIPDKVRIPAYVLIIATFVTMLEMLLKKFVPTLYSALGIYLPLIVVNCIILARAEAFASMNKVGDSILDGLGMGLGFTCALTVIGFVRELLGAGTIFKGSLGSVEFGLTLGNLPNYSLGILVLPAGGFLTLGLLMALINYIGDKNKEKKEKEHEAKLKKALEVANLVEQANKENTVKEEA
ncbi:MAG: electron transport complex subunit E [Clostridia bacterium]|nr:electron transport complex subunit E [Clostridia bacterium]